MLYNHTDTPADGNTTSSDSARGSGRDMEPSLFVFNGAEDGYDGDDDCALVHRCSVSKDGGDSAHSEDKRECCSSEEGLVDSEVEDVDDHIAQAEDDAISSEEVGSDDDSMNNDSMTTSTEDDSEDLDYDPDAGSGPPSEDDFGMPIVAIDDSGSDVAA